MIQSIEITAFSLLLMAVRNYILYNDFEQLCIDQKDLV